MRELPGITKRPADLRRVFRVPNAPRHSRETAQCSDAMQKWSGDNRHAIASLTRLRIVQSGCSDFDLKNQGVLSCRHVA